MSDQLNFWFSGDSAPLASLKKSSYSFALRGNESTIESDLNRLSESRATAYLKERQALGENITIDAARDTVGRVTVLNSELSDKAQASRRKFNKALNTLNKISGLNTSFVITESNDTFNGSLVDNERMYISADTFENDTWAETLVHEYTHLEEGSEEYAKMVDFLQSDEILVDVKTESGETKKVPLWQKAQSEVFGKDYGFAENKIKEISEKIKGGTELTAEENKLYNAFMTEVAAHETEYLLGNETFIDKLVASERSLARKIIDKILNLKKAFSKVESKSVKAQQKLLEKAEELYLAAARKAGDNALVKYITSGDSEKEEKNSAANETIRYAIKYPSFTKEDISKNINKLADMKPVANIDASKLEKTGKAPSLIFEKYFASLGNSIYSDIYGDISLGKSSVKSEIRHGITATKIASIEAIPSVIEEGEVIFFENKQGGDERVKRIVVAAPIVIADIPYYMGVMLQRDPTTQYLYLHNVAIEKEMSEYSRAHLVTTGADEQNEHLSMTIILQNAIDVKLKKQKSEDNFNFSTEKSVENGDNGGLSEAVTRTNEKKTQVTEKENTPEDNSDASEGIRFSLNVKNFTTLSDSDLSEYMATGKTLHTRHKKQRMLENGKSPILTSEREIKEFISNAIHGKAGGEVRAFARVPERLSNAISKVRSTLDLEGDYLELQADALREAYKVHASPKMQGDIALTENDFENLHHHIFNFDGVLSVNDYNGKTEIHVYRQAEKGYYQIITVASSERNSLQITKLIGVSKEKFEEKYAKKIERNTGSPRMQEASNPSTKARHTAGALSNDIIPDSDKIVNSNSKNISDTDKNIKFSLKGTEEKPYSYKLSDGKVEKQSPYSYVRKVYSKKETEGIINDVLSNYLSFGDTYGELSGKSKKDVINMLWERLNTAVPGRQAGVALDTAEYIIREAVVKSIFEDPNVEVYKDTVATLKPYLHKINLDGIKGDIKHRYDKDNSPYLLWGKRKGTNGVGADVIAIELENLGFHIEAVNEADIFFEIHEAYKNAVNELKKSAKTMLDYTLTAKERHQLKQDIAHRIHRAFDENGERKKVERFVDEKGRPTELSKLINEYEEKATEWRDKYLEQQEKHRLINVIFDKIKKLSDLEKGTFYNATQYKDNIFKTSIDQLIKIKHRSEINKSGTRRILKNLSEWYSKDNPMLSYTEKTPSYNFLNHRRTRL